jgi:mannan polymerase II complex MNN10 subunit
MHLWSNKEKPIQPHEVTIVSLYNHVKHMEYVHALQNHEQYARKHGYNWFHSLSGWSAGRHPAWSKIKLLQHLLSSTPDTRQWFWMLDADALIMNHTISVIDAVLDEAARLFKEGDPDKKRVPDFILSKDCNAHNTGSFILRNSPWSMEFLDRVWNYNQTGVPYIDGWWENAVIHHMMEKESDYMNAHTQIVPQKLLNAYNSDCGYKYQPGDFVLHFPGLDKGTFFLLMKGLPGDESDRK